MNNKTLTYTLLLCLLFASVIEVGCIAGVSANPYHPGYRYISTPSISLTSPSDWVMYQNVTVAFTVSMPGSWNGSVVGTVTSIQCFLDGKQIVKDDTTRVYSSSGGSRRLNYVEKVGPLAFGEHTLTINVPAYSIYEGEDVKHSFTSTKTHKFTVSLDPKPPPTITAKLREPGRPLYFGKTINFAVHVEGAQKQYTYTWYIDDQKVEVTTSSVSSTYYSTNTLAIGEHQIYVEVTDENSITGTTKIEPFEIVPPLPQVEISSPVDGAVYNTSEVSIETKTLAERVVLNGSAQFETLAWLNYSIDGASYSFTNITFMPHQHPYPTLANTCLFSLPNGLHQLTVYGETTFGAKVNSNATFWVYDGEAPPSPLPTITQPDPPEQSSPTPNAAATPAYSSTSLGASPSPNPSPSTTPQSTLEPTITPNPSSRANPCTDLISYVIVTLVLMLSVGELVYFKKRKRNRANASSLRLT
ncbi:MAG: hypothetical protein NWF05_05600 [Candidatus Bathyarchaeota archaeon]|nr:hypothetical protein [Candidatus Bathyarchaeota archaeon]